MYPSVFLAIWLDTATLKEAEQIPKGFKYVKWRQHTYLPHAPDGLED